MPPPRKPLSTEWPCWFHGPSGESGIFECFADVPSGWVKTKPLQWKPPPPPEEIDEEAVRAKLIELGVEIDPTWGRAHLKKVLDDRSSAR